MADSPSIKHLPQTEDPYYAAVLDIAPEAIISINEKQEIISFNKSATRIFGYQPDEVLGRPLDILLPERFVASHRQHVRDFEASAVNARLMGERQEIVGRRKDGTEFPAEASISKLRLDDRTIFTVILRDITQRKAAQAERERLIDQLRALNRAVSAITAELSLEQVLRQIVETARSLIQTRYAALGVHDGKEHFSRFITAGISDEMHLKIGPAPIGRGLLGPLIREGKAVLVNDIASHPQAVGFPEHHPHMRSLLGVPIVAKGKLIGALYLADKEDGSDFTPSDRELLEQLALHAATAIENARLYEQTQRLAILEERERFARDLHDGIIQSIYAVGLALDQAKTDIAAGGEAARQQIDLSLKSLARVIQDLRNYIFDLRPQALKHHGLKARLEGLIAEVRANTPLPISVEISPNLNAYLHEWQANHLFHICHEALSNAVRHARPGHITVHLTARDRMVTLSVEDDGIGFHPPATIRPGHRGLSNIQSRVAKLGATLTIDSAPGQGTRLTVQLPFSPQPL
ncbi:MAG: PAS domain S-box protein, partial [Caldilineae bacterium]